MEELLRKAKPEVALAVRNDESLLEGVLDRVLRNENVLKDVDDQDTIEWCQWLIAGGRSPQEWAKTVSSFDKATTCGLVWTENFVAYRCRTCGISPYLSLCTDCFHNGNHEGHDFIVFRSETGGACDCGELNVIKESGCCSLHRPRAPPSSSPPPELFRLASILMPRLFLRLIAYLRALQFRKLARAQLHSAKPSSPKSKKASRQKSSPSPPSLAATAAAMIHSNPSGLISSPPKGHRFIKLLQSFSDLGPSMRHVITSSLTCPQIYSNLCGASSITPDYHKVGLTIPSNSNTFLDELVYWTVKREFPEDLVCLLLSLRSDSRYNEAFARAFISHYELISHSILKSSDPERLCKHIAAVSVQLFSKEKLAIAMVDQMKLLHLLLGSLHSMIRSTAVPVQSVKEIKSVVDKHCTLSVIDCDNDIIRNNHYWLFKSDLKEVLSHAPVAKRFFQDCDLLSRWFEFLTLLQGMNPVKFVPKGDPHVDQESDTFVGAFMAELVISATLMCTLVGHLKDSESRDITKSFVERLTAQIIQWGKEVPYPKGTISFHLPLHRYLSVFIKQGVENQGIKLEEILPPGEVFREKVVKNVVRLQSAYYGIATRLWSRNGSSLVNQAEYYVSSLCCNSMVDADLFLCQVSAVLEPEQCVDLMMEEFGVKDLWRLEGEPDEDAGTMLENFLIFCATLVSVGRRRDEELMGVEMSVLLSKQDRGHSELTELLPEKCTGGDFDSVLGKLAEFQKPRNMQQGIFTPRGVMWEEIYDPVYTLFRSSSRAEYQSSRDRFQDWVRRSKASASKNLWPPWRLPGAAGSVGEPGRILEERKLMEGIYFVLMWWNNGVNIVSELALGLGVHLVEIFAHVTSSAGILLEEMEEVSRECVVSLLLTLYSKLDENGKQWKFEDGEESSGRIGDGAFFIGKVLHKLCQVSEEIREYIQGRGEPMMEETSAEELEREEKRRKAKERRLHLLNEYAKKRQTYEESQQPSPEESDEGPSSSSSPVPAGELSHMASFMDQDCVICMDKVKSTELFGLMTHLSPSTILGYQRLHSGDQSGPFLKSVHGETLAEHLKHFEDSSVIQHIPLEPGFGVQVESCGHPIHYECFLSFMSHNSKSPPQSTSSSSLTYREYSCPLCRQLSNSFLPVLRNSSVVSTSGLVSEIGKLIKKRPKHSLSSVETKALEVFIKDLNTCALNNLDSEVKQILAEFETTSPLVSAFLLTSHLRQVVQQKLQLMEDSSKKTVPLVLPLITCLKYQYKQLPVGYARKLAQNWEIVCGKKGSRGGEVPTLLRDCETTLYNLLLDLPVLSGGEILFGGVVQALYNLKVCQVLTSICSQFGEKEREEIGRCFGDDENLEGFLGKIVRSLGGSKMDTSGDENANCGRDEKQNVDLPDLDFIDNLATTMVIPFLKVAAYLKSELFGGDPPPEDFQGLATYLNLGSISEPSRLVDFLHWTEPGNPVPTWISELVTSPKGSILVDLLKSHLYLWDKPCLIGLPREYDNIFDKYRKVECSTCSKAPSTPALCLLCGQVLCLNELCCFDATLAVSEVVAHCTTKCGRGTGIFLSVMTSEILIVKEREACVWGSVFLDQFCEEDLELKRGKPLFLSQERLEILQRHWTTQTFYKNQELKWFQHENFL